MWKPTLRAGFHITFMARHRRAAYKKRFGFI
jgi:hypothetical protein